MRVVDRLSEMVERKEIAKAGKTEYIKRNYPKTSNVKNLNKIFDFGFTTKKIGQGTGLGLALAKKIIDEHKGKIEVRCHNGLVEFRASVSKF